MRKKITLYSLALLGTLMLFNSCKKEYESIESIDEARIQEFIKKNNLAVTKDPSGFYFQVMDPGTGALLLNKDSVLYNLKINSLDGASYFETAKYQNEGTYLGYLSPAPYRTALTGLKRGAKVKVIVPSYLAFGKNGNNLVPSNEIIVSEISVYPQAKQFELDDQKINTFLTANGLTAIKSPSRVYYKVNQVGTGIAVDIASTLTVKYTGRLLNGTVFDQTVGDANIVSQLTGLIKGWQVLLGMTKGTKVRIFVPSDLAYGVNVQNSIPASSVLDFDIELVDVTN